MEVRKKDPEFLMMRRNAAIFEVIGDICNSSDMSVLTLLQVNLNFLNIELSMMSRLSRF